MTITKAERDALRARCEHGPVHTSEDLRIIVALLDALDAMERERDEARSVALDLLADNNAAETRAEAAEVKLAVETNDRRLAFAQCQEAKRRAKEAERERDEARATVRGFGTGEHKCYHEKRAEAAEAALARAEADAGVMREALVDAGHALRSARHEMRLASGAALGGPGYEDPRTKPTSLAIEALDRALATNAGAGLLARSKRIEEALRAVYVAVGSQRCHGLTSEEVLAVRAALADVEGGTR